MDFCGAGRVTWKGEGLGTLRGGGRGGVRWSGSYSALLSKWTTRARSKWCGVLLRLPLGFTFRRPSALSSFPSLSNPGPGTPLAAEHPMPTIRIRI